MSDPELKIAYQRALRSFGAGDLKSAWQACTALHQRAPQFSLGWELSSRVALAMGDKTAATKGIERALALAPAQFSHRVQLAYCLLARGELSGATELIAELARIKPNTAGDCDALGNLYSMNKDQIKAQAWFEQAVLMAPRESHYWVNLALARQANGDLEGAEQAFDLALEHNPDEHEAALHRSRLRKQLPENNHLSQLQNALSRHSGSWRGEMTLHYALAKEYEDLGDHESSFHHLQSGSGLRRSHMRHDARGDLQAMDKIMRVFNSEFLANPALACDNAEPIFIVGLPRTGTTLVERILGSHSEVLAAGELNNFAENLTAQVVKPSVERPANRDEFIAASACIDYQTLGADYVQSTRPHTGSTAHFIDKLPLNFLYCGLIARALPQAKIIHLCRHPMDTCYAIYKTLFKQAYPFSYDLEELADYYLAYHQLMQHWHQVMPGKILDVSYEGLTADFEPQCRRLLAHCELPWEQQCLDFHQSSAPSMTASLAQVRQPVYTSSIGRWRNYSEQLKPLRSRLEQAGLALD